MGAYYNGKRVRAYYNGKLLGAYFNRVKIWGYDDHEIKLLPSPHTFQWKWNETDERTITITAGNPPFGASLISGSAYFTITPDLDNMQIKVSPKSTNESLSNRDGRVVITDNDGDAVNFDLSQGPKLGPWVIVGEGTISISYDLGATWT